MNTTWAIQNMPRALPNGFIYQAVWNCMAQQDSASPIHGALLRFVNDHFGLDAVQEFIEE